jgi:hypothetical protein
MMSAPARTSTAIPDPHTDSASAVTDGAVMVGRIVQQDGSFFAFDANFVLLGEYRTLRAAIRAIPKTEATDPVKQPKKGRLTK